MGATDGPDLPKGHRGTGSPTGRQDTARLGSGRLGMARLGMFMRLVVRALVVRSNRLVNALGAILVGAAVVTALTSLYFDISIKMSEELRAFGANVIVTPRLTDDGEAVAARGIEVETLEAVTAALPPERVIGSSPFLYGLVRLDLGNAVLAGVDFPGLRAISPYWQVEGSWVSADFDERNAMVAERAPQIGLQKAIGAGNPSIVAQFLAETALICLVAVALGLVAGYGLAQILGQAVFGAWVTFRPLVIPLALGLSLGTALVAAVLPVRGAIRVVPARVLRGE